MGPTVIQEVGGACFLQERGGARFLCRKRWN